MVSNAVLKFALKSAESEHLVAPVLTVCAETCKLLEKKNNNAISFTFKVTDTALKILASAPEKVGILNEFVNRFHFMSFSGSYADTLEARLPLLCPYGKSA